MFQRISACVQTTICWYSQFTVFKFSNVIIGLSKLYETKDRRGKFPFSDVILGLGIRVNGFHLSEQINRVLLRQILGAGENGSTLRMFHLYGGSTYRYWTVFILRTLLIQRIEKFCTLTQHYTFYLLCFVCLFSLTVITPLVYIKKVIHCMHYFIHFLMIFLTFLMNFLNFHFMSS